MRINSTSSWTSPSLLHQAHLQLSITCDVFHNLFLSFLPSYTFQTFKFSFYSQLPNQSWFRCQQWERQSLWRFPYFLLQCNWLSRRWRFHSFNHITSSIQLFISRNSGSNRPLKLVEFPSCGGRVRSWCLFRSQCRGSRFLGRITGNYSGSSERWRWGSLPSKILLHSCIIFSPSMLNETQIVCRCQFYSWNSYIHSFSIYKYY